MPRKTTKAQTVEDTSPKTDVQQQDLSAESAEDIVADRVPSTPKPKRTRAVKPESNTQIASPTPTRFNKPTRNGFAVASECDALTQTLAASPQKLQPYSAPECKPASTRSSKNNTKRSKTALHTPEEATCTLTHDEVASNIKIERVAELLNEHGDSRGLDALCQAAKLKEIPRNAKTQKTPSPPTPAKPTPVVYHGVTARTTPPASVMQSIIDALNSPCTSDEQRAFLMQRYKEMNTAARSADAR